MLLHIDIKNFTIVDKLNIDFEAGFNVLTGETGAGKSIWIDAVLIALGARCDTSVIRQGEQDCDITLSFTIEKTKKPNSGYKPTIFKVNITVLSGAI